METTEKTYYVSDNVLITNARAELAGKMYAMANVTSVALHTIKPNKAAAQAMMGWGVIAMLIGNAAGGVFALLIVLGGLIALSGLLIYLRMKPTFVVRLGSASGEVDGLTSTSQTDIAKIVSAIKTAIIERG